MARRIPQSNVGASSLLMCLFLIVTLAVSATQQPARKLGAATTYSRSNRTSLLDNIRSPASTLPASLAWLRGNSNRNSTQMMVTAPQPNEESDGEPAACSARTCLLIEQHSANNPNSMFQVQIVNICIACTICDVRAYCPDFISTIAVDPDVFVRIKETDDCLVNGGNAIVPFNLLIFQYGASFMSVIKPSTSRICKL